MLELGLGAILLGGNFPRTILFPRSYSGFYILITFHILYYLHLYNNKVCIVYFDASTYIHFAIHHSTRLAMYKTRNTGTGNGMWGTRRMRRMIYSGEFSLTFREMSPNIPGNVAKHSGECCQF